MWSTEQLTNQPIRLEMFHHLLHGYMILLIQLQNPEGLVKFFSQFVCTKLKQSLGHEKHLVRIVSILFAMVKKRELSRDRGEHIFENILFFIHVDHLKINSCVKIQSFSCFLLQAFLNKV